MVIFYKLIKGIIVFLCFILEVREYNVDFIKFFLLIKYYYSINRNLELVILKFYENFKNKLVNKVSRIKIMYYFLFKLLICINIINLCLLKSYI